MDKRIARCLAYMAVILVSLFYCGFFISAQVLGRTIPRLELNTFRFSAQIIAALVFIIVLRKNVLVVRGTKHMCLMLIGSCCYTWAILTMNLAPLYAPVGNLDSVCTTVFILVTVLCACYRRVATCALGLAAIISCVGVVCLSQPDFLFPVHAEIWFAKDPCPCVAMQGFDDDKRIEECRIGDSVDNNTAYLYRRPANLTSQRNASDDQTRHSIMEKVDTTVAVDNYKSSPIPGLGGETFGYLLMASTGISFSITLQLTERYLLPHYHYSVISFWFALLGALMSLAAMLILESPRLVGGWVCNSLLLLHCMLSSCTNLLLNLSLYYVTAEENAILSTICVVCLFIAQNTFLIDVQPVKGNVYEYVGAVLIVVACLLDPVYTIARFRWNNSKKQKQTGNKNESTETAPLLNGTVPISNGHAFESKQ